MFLICLISSFSLDFVDILSAGCTKVDIRLENLSLLDSTYVGNFLVPLYKKQILYYKDYKCELNLETAVEKTRAMELAQKNCEYYSQSQDIIRSSLSAATLQEKNWKLKTLVVKLLLPNHLLLFTSHQRPHLA